MNVLHGLTEIPELPFVPLIPEVPLDPFCPEVPDVPEVPATPPVPLPVIGGSNVAFLIVILLPSHFMYDSVTGVVMQSESAPPYPISPDEPLVPITAQECSPTSAKLKAEPVNPVLKSNKSPH
jgi:hypothetical protein